MAVPLIVFYLFFIISLFSEIIGKIGEQGDTNLKSEQGWQMDASYNLRYNGFSISISPFVSWFSNYIFLRPTGEWSVLPHAGQIYRYTVLKIFRAVRVISIA